MMEEYDEDNKDTKEETMSEQNGRRSTSPAAIKVGLSSQGCIYGF